MAAAERTPLMDTNDSGLFNTTRQFLRSFSVISDDSDFDELDEPETPGDFLDATTDGEGIVTDSQTGKHGVSFDIKPADINDGKIIPFSNIHKPRKGFDHVRSECWLKEPIRVKITDVHREEHPHMTRKAFNPNLYTIEVTHAEYKWMVKRRYKHFDSLHKALRLFRAKYSIPVPTRQHRERRQSIREERKERKVKKKQTQKISKFPKKPEIIVSAGDSLKKRRRHLEQYLQSVLESKWYRNHTEVLRFLEVSELSFVNRLGQKWKEGDVNKCSGGRRISIGCCGCLKKYHVAGRWSNRWLMVKDTFIAYIRPSDGVLCDVMLMDADFKVESGMTATGAPHGLLIVNLSRYLLAKCWTSRKADEWEEEIKRAAETTGKEFIQENRFLSYAPVREKSYARWFVDGAPYFEAVADALEKAKEEIFITDWWLSPEIYLKRNRSDREPWRLDEILARRAKAGVKVFVLLYKELEIALTINSHYSKHALMNKCPENIKVIRHPDHVAGGNRVLLWAHHEKMVVIDQKTAFLGGLDLCYGRWDDEHHRMTDYGSVTYSSSSDLIKPPPDQNGGPKPAQKAHNGNVHPRRPGHKKHKETVCPPSPILEHPEGHLAKGDSVERRSCDIQAGTQHGSLKDLQKQGNDLGVEHENARHSWCSEGEFGSSDILTDNDSLENVDKVGFTNMVAEAIVHESSSLGSHPQAKGSTQDGSVKKGGSDSDLCSNKCNTGADGEICDTGQTETKESVNTEDIVLKEDGNNLEDIESQIISDSRCVDDTDGKNREFSDGLDEKHVKNETNKSDSGITDLNKNETKAGVRFKEKNGEVHEETIVPVEAQPDKLEATPSSKKDAASKRETWATRKIRKTFRMTKAEDEDQCDGKSDKEKSDDEDDGTSRLRNKWRMVLNIKKLEHAAKKNEDDEERQPESPYMPQSPHASLGTRIRQSMPFRQRRDMDEELYHTLYPWKKHHFWRRDDSSSVTIKSVMKTSVADDAIIDDTEGLKGLSKLWIGKDYVNFIHKDPVDVHNPFEDFIERDKTPRMPWHDIGAVVYGKAARDVARHFIRRWNFCKTEKFKKNKDYPLLMPKSYSKCEVAPAIKDITYECTTQLLRSVCGWSAGIKKVEQSIHAAYIHCIKNAKHYIYIENQFFISQVGDHSLIKNEIADALLERIVRAYKEKETFRVYVVLPLLPAFEGEIGANGGYAIQAVLHWNYKSISKGPFSLWKQLLDKVDDPMKYLLFCGLRSHTEMNGKLVTELVYVHSKLMIVDDDTVIIGSANINDRSMNGTRDSEMAVMVEDTKKFNVKMAGRDHMAGGFASSLRRTLFREHLGIDEKEEIDLSDPVGDDFYKRVWTHQASLNTSTYYKVFSCIPDDHIKSFDEVKQVTNSDHLCDTDPDTAREELKKVKGRIVLFPLYFLESEESIVATGANKEAVMPVKLWI